MSITYHIDQQQRILFTEMAGSITDAELLEYVTAIWKLPDRAHCDELIDTRAITQFAVTSAGLRAADALSDRLNCDRIPSRTAIVATLTVAYGMGRMIEMYRVHTLLTVHLFRAYADALAWLHSDSSTPPEAER